MVRFKIFICTALNSTKNWNLLTCARRAKRRLGLLNLEMPNCGKSSTFSMETLISCDVRNQFLFSGNCLNRMVLAFKNGVFCPILNLPGPFLNGTSAVTSHRKHAVCWVLTEFQLGGSTENNSHLFNYFVTFPVNFPFSRLKSCFSTFIELENETWVTDFCSRSKGVDKNVTKVSFSNEIRVEKQDWKLEKEEKLVNHNSLERTISKILEL